MGTTDTAVPNLADLSIEQLRELADETPDEATKAVIHGLIDRTQELEAKQAKKGSGGRRGGLRGTEPAPRAVNAAASFMADPTRVEAWNAAIVEATDEDGIVVLTGKLVQLGVGAYHAERKHEAKAEPAAKPPKAKPAAKK